MLVDLGNFRGEYWPQAISNAVSKYIIKYSKQSI